MLVQLKAFGRAELLAIRGGSEVDVQPPWAPKTLELNIWFIVVFFFPKNVSVHTFFGSTDWTSLHPSTKKLKHQDSSIRTSNFDLKFWEIIL